MSVSGRQLNADPLDGGKNRKVGRLAFVLTVAVNAAIASLLCVAVLATLLVDPGEEQLGWGILWAFSVPGFLLFSVVSLLVYPRYISAGSLARRLGIYAAVIAMVAVLGFAPAFAFLVATQP